MGKYKLLSGEMIDISTLPEEAQKHISRIESLVQESEDYFEVNRHAFAPLLEGKYFTAKSLTELHNSPRYIVVSDLVMRYWQELYG